MIGKVHRAIGKGDAADADVGCSSCCAGGRGLGSGRFRGGLGFRCLFAGIPGFLPRRSELVQIEIAFFGEQYLGKKVFQVDVAQIRRERLGGRRRGNFQAGKIERLPAQEVFRGGFIQQADLVQP